jgi:hypothetical protein
VEVNAGRIQIQNQPDPDRLDQLDFSPVFIKNILMARVTIPLQQAFAKFSNLSCVGGNKATLIQALLTVPVHIKKTTSPLLIGSFHAIF